MEKEKEIKNEEQKNYAIIKLPVKIENIEKEGS